MNPAQRILQLQAHRQEFAPALLQLQQTPPRPLPRLLLWIVCALTAATLLWASLGKLDIVAVASGKLVPQTYVKVVQPADAGVIQDILVKEGDRVESGQILARMDPSFVQADGKTLANELQVKILQLRRVDGELQGHPPARHSGDPAELYGQMLTQYQARRQAYLDSLAIEQALLAKGQQDLNAAREVHDKLTRTLPIYQDQEHSWAKLHQEGFAGRLLAEERKRQRIEVEQELKAQTHAVEGYKASIEQSTQRIAQIKSNYQQQLMNEKVEASVQLHKLRQEGDKQARRHALMELKAPQAGIVKELATHTTGAVLQPGTVLLTIVPRDEQLNAEVWVDNEDIGFVREGQEVKLKVAPYQFQKYGMVEGTVQYVSADASEHGQQGPGAESKSSGVDRERTGYRFRGIVVLARQSLTVAGRAHALSPGMQVQAEIKLGERTVLEYLLSPVQKGWQEAGRER